MNEKPKPGRTAPRPDSINSHSSVRSTGSALGACYTRSTSMNPTKKTAFVKTEYWDCGNEKHRHKTELVALRCMERCARKKPRKPRGMTLTRNIRVTRDVLNGATFKAAGASIGVGAERAREIVGDVLRKVVRKEKEAGEQPCGPRNIANVRIHKDYWLKQIARIEADLGV